MSFVIIFFKLSTNKFYKNDLLNLNLFKLKEACFSVLTDFGSPYLYSTHGGSTRVLPKPLANPKAPRKWSAWLPNRPASKKCLKPINHNYTLQKNIYYEVILASFIIG